MKKPDITKEQVAEYIKYYYGDLRGDSVQSFIENFKAKTVYYDAYRYRTADNINIIRERRSIDLPREKELELNMLPSDVVYGSVLIITTCGKVLKNRFGDIITDYSAMVLSHGDGDTANDKA